MTDYTVIDLETSIHNTGEDSIGKDSASPHHPENFIVWAGALAETGAYRVISGETFRKCRWYGLLIGQNFKFDLLHMLYAGCVDLSNITIWDTQLAEYLLTGQESQYASLDQLSEKYGGTLKDSRMKEYWDQGISTEDIPEDEILPYLEHDVRNTELVYLHQRAQAKHLAMLPLVESQMEALLATTEMEFNGMCFDRDRARDLAASVRDDLMCVGATLGLEMSGALQSPDIAFFFDEANPGSNDQISAFLFGGHYKVRRPVEVLDEAGVPTRFKGGARKGELKTRLEDVYLAVRGQYPSSCSTPVEKEGFFKVGDEVLAKLPNSPFVDKLQQYRLLKKELSTYLEGYSALAWPKDGKFFIHGKFNHTATSTGRLSSSSPNTQNVSGKGEKA